MSWVTATWSMAAAACLTLAAMHLIVWLGSRREWGHLLFASSAVSAAIVAGFELALMRVDTAARYGAMLRWGHVPFFVLIVSIVWFVRLYLRAGLRWLAWAVCGTRALSLVLNFLLTPNLNFREIVRLHRQPLFGEIVTVAEGVSNPWMLVGNLSSLLLLAFLVDATLTVWRRDERRRALVLGGGMIFFITAAAGHSALVTWGAIRSPYFISFAFLGVILAMGHELSRDVLRAAQLARDLGESERRMELAAGAAGFGLWTWDIPRDEIWATANARRLLGVSANERLGFGRFLNALHPDDREAVRGKVEHALASLGDYEAEYRVHVPGAPARWVTARGRVEGDARGRPTLMRGVALDITGRRQAELESQHLREELTHVGRVGTMGQLASALAHELNQPLGAILRNAEAAELLLRNPSPDLEELRAIVTDIRKDDQRAGDVIDRLRALLERKSLDSQPLDVGRLMDEVVSLVRSDAAARRVTLELDLRPGLPPVRGDRVHLQQVLLNLIANGMDAMHDSAAERRLTLRASWAGDGTVEVAVSDSGTGMVPNDLERIFEPFFTTKADGMGMGLPLSRTIVEAHGGRLWAENNPDRGATFRFTVPAARGERGA